MHLHEAVVVGVGAVDDEEDVVAVLVELRALAEVLRVLERERVEAEDVAQDREVLRAGLLEVEPEERAGGVQLLDLGPVEVDLLRASVVDQMAGAHRAIVLTSAPAAR